MPLYERVCNSCSHEFEAFVRKVNDFKDIACILCGAETSMVIERLASLDLGENWTEYEWTKNKNGPKYKRVNGDGMGVLTDKGGYRPGFTHIAYCPKCKHERNCALSSRLSAIRKRFTCGYCHYQWLNADEALEDSHKSRKGYDPALAKPKTFAMNAKDASQYKDAERAV